MKAAEILHRAIVPALLLLLGCTGVQPQSELAAPAPESSASPDAAAQKSNFPQFPTGREGQGITDYVALGADSESRSNSAVTSGSDLLLIPPDGDVSWAIWRFSPHAGHLERLDFLLTMEKGNQVWLMLADFSTGRWSPRGPFSKSEGVALSREKHVSPQGDVYAALLVPSGNLARVRALSLRAYSTDGQAPLAQLSADIDFGNAPLTVSFDASGSSDPGGEISHYLWDFEGDGTFEGMSFEPTITHEYLAGGDFNATVTVVDNDGDSAEAHLGIDINSPPVVSLEASHLRAFSGEKLEFVAEASDAEGEITQIEWSFEGEGLGWSGETDDLQQVVEIIAPPKPQVITASVRVRDEEAGYSTASVNVEIRGYFETEYLTGTLSAKLSAINVAGRPAVFYANGNKLTYSIKRLGPWSGGFDSTTVANATTHTDSQLQLQMINEKPAVMFTNSVSGGLHYAWSDTASGLGDGNWHVLELAGQQAGKHGFSLCEVEGHPASAYSGPGESGLVYLRSATPQGDQPEHWQQPLMISEYLPAGNLTLLFDGYRPAVTAVLDGELRLLFSDDEIGSSGHWFDAESFSAGLQPVGNAIQTGGRLSLAFLDGSELLCARPDSYYDDWQFKNLAQTDGPDLDAALQMVDNRVCIALRSAAGVRVFWAVDYDAKHWQAWPEHPLNTSQSSGLALMEYEGNPLIVVGKQNRFSLINVR